MPDSSNNTSAFNAETPSAGRLLSDPPGEVLKKARQARKLDLATAADQLNLSTQVVKALEEDAYDKLPSPTFIRGYIRCYARLLKLSGDDLVRSYERITMAQQPEPQGTTAAPEVTPQKIKKGWMVVGLLVVIAIAVGFIATSEDLTKNIEPESGRETDVSLGLEVVELKVIPEAETTLETTPETIPETIPETDIMVPEVVRDAEPPVEPEIKLSIATSEKQKAEPVSVMPVEEPNVVDSTISDVPDAALVTAPISVVSEASVSGLAVSEPAVLDGAIEVDDVQVSVDLSTLLMTFSGECWVEVWDATGKRIYANLRKAGHKVSLQGVAPIEVKLGDGSVAKLEFNGSPVLFASSKRTSVAHVTLGE